MAMKQYKETRRLNASDLRSLCIEKNWYTAGTNPEYSHLLGELAGEKENLTTEDIILIAEDIAAHSKLEDGYEISDIAFEVTRKAYSFFTEIKTRYNVMLRSAGGTKHLLTSFDDEKAAEEFCEQLNWEWTDPETTFVWSIEIDEVEE